MSVEPGNFGVDDFASPAVSGGGGACDYPDEADVALGVTYGSGLYTGTLPCGRGETAGTGLLLHSPAQIFQELLIQLSLAERPLESTTQDASWTVYASTLPDSPDRVVVCYDTTAKTFPRETVLKTRTEHSGLQILVRGPTHPSSFTKVRELANALDTGVLNNVVALTDPVAAYFIKDAVRQPINSLGKESPKSKRSLWTINLTSAIRRIS